MEDPSDRKLQARLEDMALESGHGTDSASLDSHGHVEFERKYEEQSAFDKLKQSWAARASKKVGISTLHYLFSSEYTVAGFIIEMGSFAYLGIKHYVVRPIGWLVGFPNAEARAKKKEVKAYDKAKAESLDIQKFKRKELARMRSLDPDRPTVPPRWNMDDLRAIRADQRNGTLRADLTDGLREVREGHAAFGERIRNRPEGESLWQGIKAARSEARARHQLREDSGLTRAERRADRRADAVARVLDDFGGEAVEAEPALAGAEPEPAAARTPIPDRPLDMAQHARGAGAHRDGDRWGLT